MSRRVVVTTRDDGGLVGLFYVFIVMPAIICFWIIYGIIWAVAALIALAQSSNGRHRNI